MGYLGQGPGDEHPGAAPGSSVGAMPGTCTECGEPARARKLCNKHYLRWKKHGDPQVVLKPGVKPNYELDSYGAQHYHVRVIRGTPSCCEHCGTNDPDLWYEWAFNHIGDRNNVEDYIRLCRSCHRKFDETSEKLDQLALARAIRWEEVVPPYGNSNARDAGRASSSLPH